MKTLCGTLFLLAATLVGGPAHAAAAIVTQVTGSVEVRDGVRPGETASVGRLLDPGATVVTGENSTAVIRFEDGQVAALAERSNFRIVGYEYRADQPEKSSSFVNLIEGGLRFLTGLLGSRNPSAVRIQVGTVTMGIRGTDTSSVTDAGDAVTTVNEGQVAVSLPTGETVVVPAGLGVNVRKSGAYQLLPAAQILAQLRQTVQGRRIAAQLTRLEALTPRIDEAIKSPPPSQVQPKPPAPEAPPPPPPAAPAVTTTPTSGTSGGGGTPASPN